MLKKFPILKFQYELFFTRTDLVLKQKGKTFHEGSKILQKEYQRHIGNKFGESISGVLLFSREFRKSGDDVIRYIQYQVLKKHTLQSQISLCCTRPVT